MVAIGLAIGAVGVGIVAVATLAQWAMLAAWGLGIAALVTGIVGFVAGARASALRWRPVVALAAGVLAVIPAAASSGRAYARNSCIDADIAFMDRIDPSLDAARLEFRALPAASTFHTMTIPEVIASQRRFLASLETLGDAAEADKACSTNMQRVRVLFMARGTYARDLQAQLDRIIASGQRETIQREEIATAFLAFGNQLAENGTQTASALDAWGISDD